MWSWPLTCGKGRSRRYPARNITDTNYADDIKPLANTPAQAGSLLHSLEQAPGNIGLYVKANKTEYMCFNHRVNISTLNSGSLKLEDKFTYLGSSVSSTENDINTRLAKTWTAIDRLSVLWKSDLSDRIIFSKQRICSYYCIDATLGYWKSLTVIAQGCFELYWTNLGSNIPQNSSCRATCLLSRTLFKLDEQDMRYTAWRARMNAYVTFSLHTDAQV